MRILIGKDLNLTCEKCRMAIHVKGICKCNFCGHETDIIGKWDDEEYCLVIQCEVCKSEKCEVRYTQYVESKHRKGNHYYYHFKCWESLFFDA